MGLDLQITVMVTDHITAFALYKLHLLKIPRKLLHYICKNVELCQIYRVVRIKSPWSKEKNIPCNSL
jgi:hypothetical protein